MYRVIFLIILGVFVAQPSWSIMEMKECNDRCRENISVEECINDELLAWDTEDRRKLIENCKNFIREEYRQCVEECIEDDEK